MPKRGSFIYMKKIALAIENFSQFAGGAESYAVSLANRLSASGWEVHLFGQTWDGEPNSAVFHKLTIPKLLPSWAKMILFALKHRKMVKNLDLDVILGFGNTIYMNVYQSHGGVHRISTARKVYVEKNATRRLIKRIMILLSVKYWVRHWIESAPFRLDKRPKLVAISQMIKEDMESFFHISDGGIDVVYNGFDTAKYTSSLRRSLRGPLRKKLGINENDVVFLFVSYDLKKKGILPLVEAAKLLKAQAGNGFKILIVGGLPHSWLQKRVENFGLIDTFMFIGRSKSPEECYANSDVLVLPTYYDACSLVVFEAMACGLPSITTIYNGAAGIITNEKSGYIISHPPEPLELAEKMRTLMCNETRERMSREAVRSSKKYTNEKNHQDMIRIFHEVIHENTHPFASI